MRLLAPLAMLILAPPFAFAAEPSEPSAPAGPPRTAPAPPSAAPEIRHYAVRYDVRIVPTERVAYVEITLGAGASLVHSIRLAIDPDRHLAFSADGGFSFERGGLLWKPPDVGGSLSYVFRIDQLRGAASYDARCAENWALFRGGDLVPPVRVVTEDGARSQAELRFRLPKGWSVAVPYERRPDGTFLIVRPERHFDRPTGWMIAGRLGVLRERIARTAVAVAGPTGEDVRRQDMLALLRWTLPTLRDILGQLPDRLLVVSAGDPMWRGGLSGPRSLYVHADRPLITGDLTSPILHELFHSVTRSRSGPGGDWIVEGLAEYYSLQLLVRSKTVSKRRYQRALARLEERGKGVRDLAVETSEGAVTARAVTVMHRLDREIQETTDGAASLDDVVAQLTATPAALTLDRLQTVVSAVTGQDFARFFANFPRAPQPAPVPPPGSQPPPPTTP